MRIFCFRSTSGRYDKTFVRSQIAAGAGHSIETLRI